MMAAKTIGLFQELATLGSARQGALSSYLRWEALNIEHCPLPRDKLFALNHS